MGDMKTWTSLQRTGAILVAGYLTFLNALSIFTSQTQVPPHISGVILTLSILFSIRGSRRHTPLRFVDALPLWVIFGPITIIPFLLLSFPMMAFGGMWQADFIDAVLHCLYVWLPTSGIMYLPGAAVLVYLYWQRAENHSQKFWLLLCGFITVGYLLYDLRWFMMSQELT
jgi:hypothetical protein